MRRRKSRVARAAKSSEGAMFAAQLAQSRKEYPEEIGSGQGWSAPGAPRGQGAERRKPAETLAGQGGQRGEGAKNAPGDSPSSRAHRRTATPPPHACMDIHTPLTTLTTQTGPATARDCAVRVTHPRAGHPDQIEDFGDEREHDLWLSGVSIHDLP